MFTRFRKVIRSPARFAYWYDTKLKQRPLFTRMCTYFVLFSSGDMLSQYLDFTTPYHPDQALKYGLIGFCFSAPLLHCYLNIFIDRMFPDIYCIAWYVLIKYEWALSLYLLSNINHRNTIFLISNVKGCTPSEAVQKVKDNLYPTLLIGWRIWPFVALLNFTIMPLRYNFREIHKAHNLKIQDGGIFSILLKVLRKV